jgi:predicted  nucleic acid-binding Zn-ribbon protein
MQPIEGITPEGLWTTASVLLGLAGIAIIVFKIVEFKWKFDDRKQSKHADDQKPVENLDARLQKIEKRLDSIDDKLSSDKRRLEALERQQDDADAGFKALCKATLAILNNRLHNGNTDEMEAAQKTLTDYLIGK